LDVINKLELDIQKCIGIGTDGEAVMVSESCGAVSEIQKKCCNAVRCPRFNHDLNNSLAQASTIPSIRNSIGTLKAIIAFFQHICQKT